MTYFKKPVGRATDGRVLLDFLAQALGLPFLSPYLQSIGSDYKHASTDEEFKVKVDELPVRNKWSERVSTSSCFPNCQHHQGDMVGGENILGAKSSTNWMLPCVSGGTAS
ncbi:hypothetical protein HAX54_044340 [Datura stramonium]|uniref:Uncharacterized protein n=1 Tax=Datura stramonium TaxID=4076 RepID=A0ABS8SPQ2_DATST|nr:hypothetical protein [Datura stramonium]